MRHVARIPMVTLLSAAVVIGACSKKDDDSDSEEATTTPPVAGGGTGTETAAEPVRPGVVMLSLDGAMGSIAFAGQAGEAAALTNTWTSDHCEETNNATKAAYDDDMAVVWGCLLSTKTDGPDTPRGGVNRVKQVACSMDQAIEAGDLKVDGTAYTIKIVIDHDCWGAAFAEMAAGQLPDLINATTGFVEVESTVTGHVSVPSTWSDVASQWDTAYEIAFGFSADSITTYKMLLRQGDDGVAAAIHSVDSETGRPEVFAMAIDKIDGGTEDEHSFRYEGRFPYGEFGDGSFGSRHVRVAVSGPYAGSGGFSRIDAGYGFQAEMFGSNADTITGGSVSTFVAGGSGLGAKKWNVGTDGAVNGSATESGVAGVNDFDYTGAASELAAFLATAVADYTGADAWFKAKGPLDYDSVVISD